MKNIFIFLSLTVLFAACNSQEKANQTEVNSNLTTTLDQSQKEWVERTLSNMSISEMAAQVVMDWYGGYYTPVESDEFEREKKEMERGNGGLWLNGGGPYDQAVKSNELGKYAKVPLLVASFKGLGSKLFETAESMKWASGAGTDLPPAMAYGAIGDPQAIKEAGRIVGIENQAIGNHVAGGREVSVLLNLENVLHNRCLGDDPEQIALLASAYISGVHEVGRLTKTSVFPGAGSLEGDPHVVLPITWEDRQTFDSIHFVPFRAAIKAGTDMIMTSHFATPGLTGLDTLPATLSPEITRILREDLGFEGVLITDAMAMGGITNTYEKFEASILAFKAGNDMILGPPYFFSDTLANRVEKGEIPLDQLKSSVRRILELKAKVGLHKENMVNLENISTIVGRRSHQMIADSAASRSIVLLRDKNAHVPLDFGSSSKVLSISYEREDNRYASREFNRILGNHVKSVDTERISPSSGPSVYNDLYQQAQNFDKVIFSVYLRPLLGREVQDKMSDSFIQFVKDLQSEDKEVILVSFGELEVLDDLPELGTFMLAWSSQDVMQRAAAKAILGINPISGHLPINLLPFHKRGEGLERKNTLR